MSDIKLGGKRVLSLDFDLARVAIDTALPQPSVDLVIGFDAQQTRILEARSKGYAWSEVADVIGVDQREVERIKKQIQRKLLAPVETFHRQARGNSVRLVVEERIAGGRKVWALEPLGEEFAQIMQSEKKYFANCPSKALFGTEG